MYRSIVFDVDGTLIDTEKALLGSLQKLLRDQLGKEFPQQELTFTLGIPGIVALEQMGITNPEQLNLKWNDYLNDFEDQMRLFDGVTDVLEELNKGRILTGVVTSKMKMELKCTFSKFDISRYFPYVVCADDTINHKPNPDPLYKFMELSGLQAGDLLYVGDTAYDMNCARTACVDFGVALWGAKNPDQIHAEHRFKTPWDILSLFGGQF